ncbi:MAG: beta-ketoacyl synthase N-terminal-like domain-containing protein, partial [Chloroflexota bacterium]
AEGFLLAPELIARLDQPAQWTLHLAREALTDAGLWGSATALDRCGLVLGNLSFPTRASRRTYSEMYTADLEAELRELLGRADLRLPRVPRRPGETGPDTLLEGSVAGRVGNVLGAGGPCFAIDAACASSLYAVKLASDCLLAGEADVMLAGAVSCADPLFINMGFSIFQAYPDGDGGSRPLDGTSGGLLAGEGAGLFVLKREADALRDGDRVYAVVRGVGLSNDGRGKHLLTPNSKGQVLAMERAYAAAGLTPADVDYVECHATGTPVGDVVELNSMSQVFEGEAPPIGSVKSNLGHLLTAAGMAGMIKTTLAMNEGVIPATINVEQPISSRDGRVGGSAVVRSATEWPKRGPLKSAGVSAFGFGGSDAHLILSEPAGASAAAGDGAGLPRMAITGMGAHAGGCDSLAALDTALYDGRQQVRDLPAMRWKAARDEAPRGAYIEDFEFDFLRFGVPPRRDGAPIPQQLLVLAVADEAIRDAQLAEGGHVAVVVAMQPEVELHRYATRLDFVWQVRASLTASGISLSDVERERLLGLARDGLLPATSVNQYVSFIGNIMASRIAAQWDFSGPAFTVSAGDNSALQALDVARHLLADASISAVVVAAVDLPGSQESVRFRQESLAVGGATMSHNASAGGWLVGEAAGAVVVQRVPDSAGGRVYATIDGLALARGAPIAALSSAASHALFEAGVAAGHVGILEMHASGLATEDEAELAAMLDLYGVQNADEHARASNAEHDSGAARLAISSSKAVLGHARAASGITALIRTALCLYQRYVPGTPGWRGPAEPEAWAAAGWYVAPKSRPWATSAAQPRRIAAINGLGDGGAAHAILSQASAAVELVSRYARQSPAQLLLVGASDAPSLVAELVRIEARLRSCSSLQEAARALERAARGARLKVALVGGSLDELRAEADRALVGIPEAVAADEEWSTPAGSYFTPTPLGVTGELALVYSGGISSYIGLGRTLQRAFPFLTDRLEALGPDFSLVTGERRLYPRSVRALSLRELAARERQLVEDGFAVAASGTTHSLQTGAVLREAFGVTPQAVFGLSLGEASMMAGHGVWDLPELARQAMVDPERVEPQLGRAKMAAREYWGMSPDVPAEEVWGTYLVLASPDDVTEALKSEDRAFLAMIGTPREALLFGQPEACRRVIGRLGCGSAPAPFNYVLHVPPAEAAIGTFASLYRRPVVGQPSVRFYSASRPAPLALESDEIASAIAATVCRQLDFPALVRRVYDSGVRIFVELGPGATCARWIRESLGAEPHLAVSVDQKGVDSRVTLVRTLARLACHGVPVRLTELFGDPELAASPKRSSVQRVVLGGIPLRAALRQDSFPEGSGADCSADVVTRRARLPVAPGKGAATLPAEGHGVPSTVAVPGAATLPVGAQSAAGGDGPLLAAESAFLALQNRAVGQLGAIVERQIGLIAGQADSEPGHDKPDVGAVEEGRTLSLALDQRTEETVWDEADLLEFAEGSISSVFGADYAPIDGYRRRVRLPLPPYLLVSRVTKLQAQRGVFEPSTITTEYDIPLNSGYATDGQVAWAVAVESGQCDLLLISYLGVDFENRGERVYRLLDCALTFLGEVPVEGQTLRYDISINSFARSGDDLLFFFSYNCYVGAQLILKMDGGCAGFFSDEELAQGKGVIYTEAELEERRAVTPRQLAAPLTCGRRAFDYADLERLSTGDLSAVFGAAYDKHDRNPSLRLPPASMRMFDRVTSMQPEGGSWGLGALVAEKDLAPDDWYFPCHFKDDEVLAGSLMAEGCVQLLQLYMLSLGCHTLTRRGRFQPIKGLRQVVRCRGQVTPWHPRMTYKLEVKEVGLAPEPWAIANVEIWVDGKMVVHFKDLGIRIVDD